MYPPTPCERTENSSTTTPIKWNKILLNISSKASSDNKDWVCNYSYLTWWWVHAMSKAVSFNYPSQGTNKYSTYIGAYLMYLYICVPPHGIYCTFIFINVTGHFGAHIWIFISFNWVIMGQLTSHKVFFVIDGFMVVRKTWLPSGGSP